MVSSVMAASLLYCVFGNCLLCSIQHHLSFSWKLDF
jgi:hypothetical protein